MKKTIAVLLAMTLIAVSMICWGCTGESETKHGEEPTKITFLGSGDRLAGENMESDPVVEFIEKKFNVEFDFIYEPSPTETEVYTKLNMMMANGEVPDVMVLRADQTLPYTAMEDLIEAGYLLDIQEYVKNKAESFPNIYELVNRDNLKTYYASDNHLYILPREYVYDHAYIYRQDWLDKLGLSMPTNEKEFKAVLKAFVDNDPDGRQCTGLSMTYGFWFEHIFAGFVGAHRFYEQNGELRSVWDADGERAVQMMQGLQYCIDLYQEGLLYQDVFSGVQNRDELALFESGRAGVILTGLHNVDNIYKTLKENFPDAELSYGVWSGPAGLARVQGGVNYYLGTAFNAKSGKVDKIMQIFEYLMSEEGEDILTKGLEGVHYTRGENGEIQPILDAEGIEYFLSPSKHNLRGWVKGTQVYDEIVQTQPWAAACNEFYDKYCINSTAVYDMTDGYYSRLSRRYQSQIGNKPELTIQKWEGFFITGFAYGKPITLTKETFKDAWADLKENSLDVLSQEYSKLIFNH